MADDVDTRYALATWYVSLYQWVWGIKLLVGLRKFAGIWNCLILAGMRLLTTYAYGTYLSYLHIIPDNYVLLAI
jgi:hypothetical protein